MTRIDPDTLAKRDRHRLLIDSIVPRPIAWITSVGEEGVVNLAPFSYFMGVTSSPPSLAVSIGARTPAKDTLQNLRDTGEGVVHLVPASCLEAVNATGAELDRHRSEVEALGLETLPSEHVKPPRLAVAEVAFECRLIHELHVGSPGGTICVLEVVLAHVDEGIAGPDGIPDPARHRAVARLGERFYLRAEGWRTAELPRPELPGP